MSKAISGIKSAPAARAYAQGFLGKAIKASGYVKNSLKPYIKSLTAAQRKHIFGK